MERRREGWAARKAGRLLAHAFGRCHWHLLAAANVRTGWHHVGVEAERALKAWDRYSEVLAGTVSQDDWNEIRGAVTHLEQLELRGLADNDDGEVSDELTDDDAEFLQQVAEDDLWNAAFAASFIGMVGVSSATKRLRMRIRNRLKSRKRREREAGEALAYFQAAAAGMPRPPSEEDEEETAGE
jgi:hypothetical protein